ncbi:D-aspartate oxidase-like [Sitodiplosis mosellana]|uniref:D-aspartate oxidase-like n=1 Tax=Sitodiplosis mosellana TaxID=263140 RepID=UPI002445207A|nr:D-aspartate oxidase-like [Sitodiplosis mosellana]
MEIAIIGAGVVGSTTAFQLLEQFGKRISVTVFAVEFSPSTTSDVSSGLWSPRGLNGRSPEKVLKWSKDMHDFFEKLWKSGEANEAGVSLISVTRITTNNTQRYNDLWRDVVFDHTDLDQKVIERLSQQHKRSYTSGIYFTTFTCEPSLLLPHLYNRIQAADGRIERKRIESFEDLDTFDLVINCTRIGAQKLVKDDAELKAVRGQVMRVEAPWIFDVLLDDSDNSNYIIPNMNTVVLGGTHQTNDYRKKVDANDRRFIYKGCSNLNPSLKRAEIFRDMVGLRPGRDQVRLERDLFITKRGKQLQMIHNYGHGGSGVTLSYGCAINVADIVNAIMMADTNKRKSIL